MKKCIATPMKMNRPSTNDRFLSRRYAMKKILLALMLSAPALYMFWGCTNSTSTNVEYDTIFVMGEKDTIFEKDTIYSGQKFANFASSNLTDIEILKTMPIMEWLNLSNNQFTDLSPIAGFTKLKYLNLSNCDNIVVFSTLNTLTALTYLSLQDCQGLYSIPDLAKLTNLTTLNLSGCDSLNLSGLKSLTNIKNLDLRNTKKVTDLATIKSILEAGDTLFAKGSGIPKDSLAVLMDTIKIFVDTSSTL
jgi:hypothetical protein